jgi:hypothetical protein
MKRTKYPSTPHLPFSPGLQNDDTRILTLSGFQGREVVVTEKMDGENTTMYMDHIHARSVDSRHHPSRDWVKWFWSNISYLIPEGWRICGENVYARHSVQYDNLETYFYGFSIWNADNVALSWDDTLFYFEEVFNIKPVPVLYRGQFDEKILENLAESIDPFSQEGFVVRVTDEIPYNDFDLKVAKWVRKGHVQTNKHWMQQEVVPNGLKREAKDQERLPS